MTSQEIFAQFEQAAIEWGKQYQIAKVGDIVLSNLGGKRRKQLVISQVCVSIGRNAQKTTLKTFVLRYSGRRLNSKGEFIDELGSGRCLMEFTTESGGEYDYSEYGVNDECNDMSKMMYPNAYGTYSEPFHQHTYPL